MNDNNDSDNRQQNCQESSTSQRTRTDGLSIYSTRHTDNCVYSPKTPYNERKTKSPKGTTGFSHKQNEQIELALYKLGTTYGFNNCKWFVFTFDEALVNLLISFNSLDRAIKFIFNNKYKRIDVKPYIIVYGLRKRTSYSRDIPCLDINIICAVTNKFGIQLFNEQALVNEVYQRTSKFAKETIQIPTDYYSNPPYNSLEDYKQLANYLKKQVDNDLLTHFKNSQYASLLPNTYVHIHDSMKKTFVDYKVNYMGTTSGQHRELLQDKFSDRVTVMDKQNFDYKCVAQLNLGESTDKFITDYQREFALKHPQEIKINNSDVENIPDDSTSFDANNYGEERERIIERKNFIIKQFGEYAEGATGYVGLAHTLVKMKKEVPEVYEQLKWIINVTCK